MTFTVRKAYVLVAMMALLGSANARALDAAGLVAGITNASADARAEAWKDAGPVGGAGIAALGKYLADPNPGITKAARAALTTIVAYAGRPGAAPTEAPAVAGELAKLLDKAVPEAARREVLNELSLIGRDAEVPAIAALLSDPVLADDARVALERIPGDASVKALIAALDTAAPELRGHIAITLGKRGAGDATLKLVQLVKSGGRTPDSWDCLDALAMLGVAPMHIIQRQTGFTPAESKRYMDEMLTAADALAAQGKRGEAERLFASVAAFYDSPAQASVGLNGLAAMASEKLIPHAMGNLSTPGLRNVAIEALVSAKVSKIDEVAVKAYALNKGVSDRTGILEVLAGRKSPQLATLLADAVADKSAEVRVAAAALSGKAPAEADLLDVAVNGTPWGWEPALQRYLVLAEGKRNQGDKDGARSMFENVVKAKLPQRYTVSALEALGNIGAPSSLDVVKGVLQERELVVAAGRAYVDILGSQENKDKVKADLLAFVDEATAPEVLSAAVDHLKQLGADTQAIARKKGFITNWRVLGPFPNTASSAFKKSFFPEADADGKKAVESEGKKYEWKDVSSDLVPAKIDLRATFDPHDNVAAYGYAEVNMSAETPALALFGSDDGCELWINGEKKFEVNGGRPMKMDGDRVEAVLKPGVNKILIKVLQGGGTWEYCLRLVGRDGKPLAPAH